MWRGFLRFRQASDGACPNTVSSHLAPLFSFHALLCISPFSLPFLFLTLEISSLVPFFVVCLLDAISLRNSWEQGQNPPPSCQVPSSYSGPERRLQHYAQHTPYSRK